MKQPSRRMIPAIAAILVLASAPSGAEDSKMKETAKEVGHAVGSAAREVGTEAKKFGKAVGEVAKEGVEAVKEGGKELKRAAKGESSL